MRKLSQVCIFLCTFYTYLFILLLFFFSCNIMYVCFCIQYDHSMERIHIKILCATKGKRVFFFSSIHSDWGKMKSDTMFEFYEKKRTSAMGRKSDRMEFWNRKEMEERKRMKSTPNETDIGSKRILHMI